MAAGLPTVQAAEEDGNGDISLTSGIASLSMAADFDHGHDVNSEPDRAWPRLKVPLTDQHVLRARRRRSTDTDAATDLVQNTSGLDLGWQVRRASFSGGFYGAQAAEAGGVFDFWTVDNDLEAGAFRGAFGGDRKGL